MIRNKNTFPVFDDPLVFAVSLSGRISGEKHASDKQRLGQYFTPARLAEFTAGLESEFLKTLSGSVRILDPGTGTGILSCALIQKLAEFKSIHKIELTCFEIDSEAAEGARLSFDYLEKWLQEKGVSLTCILNQTDFITEHSALINSFPDILPSSSVKYDIIISNPPFYKLSSGHSYIASANFNFRYHLNIYHLFLFLSANLIKDPGRMLFIIPSVFFAGGYFAELRKIILGIVSVEKVLFIQSPGGIFEQDSMLADTSVISFSINKSGSSKNNVRITAYDNFYSERGFDYFYSYDPKINRLPFFTGSDKMQLFNKVEGWHSTVSESGYRVNAGQLLYTEAASAFAPSGKNRINKVLYLFYHKAPGNKNIDRNKYIYAACSIFCSEELPDFLQPACNLVLVRRYNSSGAVPVQSSPFLIENYETEHLAVDKKLLYIDKPGCTMTAAETIGLSLILNSRLIREYIRITYGKINLTIQEFLKLPLPSEEVIIRTGKLFISTYSQRTAEI